MLEKTETVLVEKINQLDNEVLRLREALHQSKKDSLSALGAMRLHGAILLSLGNTAELLNWVKQSFGDEAVKSITNNLFVLDNAPMPESLIQKIKTATDNGMTRW